MFDWFVSYLNVSKSVFLDMLILQYFLLLNGNMLLSIYLVVEKFIELFFLFIIIYYVCFNDCILFCKILRYDYFSFIQCFVCGVFRYVGVNKQVVRKFYYYLLGL